MTVRVFISISVCIINLKLEILPWQQIFFVSLFDSTTLLFIVFVVVVGSGGVIVDISFRIRNEFI
jgi:hypothetical protein